MSAREHQAPSGPARGERPHPGPATYLKAASVLAGMTVVEVSLFYVKALQDVLVVIFLLGTVAELSLVAMFYMHLRYDSRVFAWLFMAGLLVAAAIIVALMGLFGVFGGGGSA